MDTKGMNPADLTLDAYAPVPEPIVLDPSDPNYIDPALACEKEKAKKEAEAKIAALMAGGSTVPEPGVEVP